MAFDVLGGGDLGTGRFGINNKAAARREAVIGNDLLADKSVAVRKLDRSAWPADIKGTSADVKEPSFHSDPDAVAQEQGTQGGSFSNVDHNHDRTYVQERATTDKATAETDYVAGATSITDTAFDPGGGPPNYQDRVVSWTLTDGLQPSAAMIYASYSQDAGATWSRMELVGRVAPGIDQYRYIADSRWNFSPTASPATTVRYALLFPSQRQPASFQIPRTGSDGKLDDAFMPATITRDTEVPALAGVLSGAGSPEGVVTATVGTAYRDTTNGNLYVKATGTGNTGWALVYRAGGTDVPIADGGTGASTASDARTNLGLGTVATLASDTDGTLAANSDSKVATQKATKIYVDASVAAVAGSGPAVAAGGGGALAPVAAATTALTTNDAVAVWFAAAIKANPTVDVSVQVTTAYVAAGGTPYTKVVIAKGAFAAGNGASLTTVGTFDASTLFAAPSSPAAARVATVATSGVSPGEHLWIVLGTKTALGGPGGVVTQFAGTNPDPTQGGVVQFKGGTDPGALSATLFNFGGPTFVPPAVTGVQY